MRRIVANTRYSPLDQINAANFNELEVAWSVKTDVLGARKEYQFEPTPLLVKGRLFLPAGSRRDCIALDAATGELLWMHRLDEGQRALNSPRQLSGPWLLLLDGRHQGTHPVRDDRLSARLAGCGDRAFPIPISARTASST